VQILIVDDDHDARSSVAELVRLLGHTPVLADGGALALEIASQAPVDVALLDIEMPDMSGHELARRLVLLRRQSVYIVAVTGRGSEADIQLSVSAGFFEHIVKPCTKDRLSKVLAHAADHLQRRHSTHKSHGPRS